MRRSRPSGRSSDHERVSGCALADAARVGQHAGMSFRTALLTGLLAGGVLAQSPDPLLARLPADASNVLIVRDVLPHVEALLRSPQVRELLDATGELQEEQFGMRFDPAALQQQLNLVRGFVPLSAGFGMSTASVERFVVTARTMLLAGLLMAAQPARGVPAELLEAVRTEAARALAVVAEPDLLAWITLRDPRLAESWFDAAVEALQPMAEDPGLELTVEDSVLTVRVAPMTVGGGRVHELLTKLGVAIPADFAPRWTAQLRQDGGDLTLRVGKPAAGPLAPATFGRVWTGTRDELAAMRFDMTSLVEMLETDLVHVENLAEYGAKLQQFAMRVSALLTQIEELAVPTTGSVRVGDGLQFVQEGDLGGDVAELVPAPPLELVRCLRPDEGPFSLVAVPLDQVVMYSMEEGVARAARRGDVPPVLTALQQFFAGEDSAVFASGCAFVSRAAAFRGAAGWQHGPMPFAAGAVLGVLDEGEDAAAFVRELSLVVGEVLDLDGPLTTAKDLGLGVPTQALRLELLPAPFGVGVDADWAPHWFQVGAVLVVSTDVGLSRDLLQRLRGEAAPTLPPGRLVSWSLWRGSHLAAAFAGLMRWLEVTGQAKGDPGLLRTFTTVCDLAGRLLDRFEWITDLDGNVLRQRLDVRLVPAAKK